MVELVPKLETLRAPQIALWHELGSVPTTFTLYGGTGIALHLGHRESIDFDFFCFQDFDPDRVLGGIPFLEGAEVLQREANTLTCLVDRDGPIQVSFFGVPKLGRIAKPLCIESNGVRVADLIDLAGTKASVIQKRAQLKDYLDLDALLTAGIGLERCLGAGKALYGPSFNAQITTKAMTYFQDPDVSRLPHDARERLRDAARRVDLANLPVFDAVKPHGDGKPT